MPGIVYQDHQLVPQHVSDFNSFLSWTRSKSFPELGRIDFVAQCIEIDMSPEELFTHGRLKAELARVLGNLCVKSDLMIFVDGTRISSAIAGLSTEPDVAIVSRARIRDGQLRLIPSPVQPSRFIEIEGGPDIAIEIISESSVTRDSVRLPESHFLAGTLEYWLIDARDEQNVRFEIQTRGASAFVSRNEDWQVSCVMNKEFKLHADVDQDGWPEFSLEAR
jgi:Uma2 family endonuclease